MAQGGFDAVTRDRRDGCDVDARGEAFVPPLDVIATDGCILLEMVLPWPVAEPTVFSASAGGVRF